MDLVKTNLKKVFDNSSFPLYDCENSIAKAMKRKVNG